MENSELKIENGELRMENGELRIKIRNWKFAKYGIIQKSLG